MATLTFKTKVQKALFVHEIRGQLSDGYWENATPSDHYRPWCTCEVAVGPTAGRDFYPRRDRYGLTAAALLDVVGNRMVKYARVALSFEEPLATQIIDALNMQGDLSELKQVPAEVKERAEKALADVTLYNRNDLKKDLTAMKLAMRTHVGGTAPQDANEERWAEFSE